MGWVEAQRRTQLVQARVHVQHPIVLGSWQLRNTLFLRWSNLTPRMFWSRWTMEREFEAFKLGCGETRIWFRDLGVERNRLGNISPWARWPKVVKLQKPVPGKTSRRSCSSQPIFWDVLETESSDGVNPPEESYRLLLFMFGQRPAPSRLCATLLCSLAEKYSSIGIVREWKTRHLRRSEWNHQIGRNEWCYDVFWNPPLFMDQCQP